ncbi:GntR family transcriptional regulator [Kribbella solani]|uniref:GntR family transcriptional regulator n=1 Tax=Kribbella solani TaxID=236067 RepID=A0A841DMR5_9ACTN|nr:GntR family transcriptional regulator [Kribbella solani]MBB5977950.1 GntR family transcriptional regulator [Kribbella solani]
MSEQNAARPAPKHQQVRDSLAAEIRRLEPHSALASERDLATTHGVSRATIRIALDALSDAGVVYRVQGAGTFAAGPAISKTLSLSSFTEDMEVRGWTASSRLLAADQVPAGGKIADDLGIAAEDEVIRVSRIRLADGTPICMETVHLAADGVPGLLDHDLSTSLYGILEAEYGLRVVRAEQVVRSVVMDVGEAALLGQPPGSAALRVHRIGLDQRDRPIESTTSMYRGDMYDLRFAVQR